MQQSGNNRTVFSRNGVSHRTIRQPSVPEMMISKTACRANQMNGSCLTRRRATLTAAASPLQGLYSMPCARVSFDPRHVWSYRRQRILSPLRVLGVTGRAHRIRLCHGVHWQGAQRRLHRRLRARHGLCVFTCCVHTVRACRADECAMATLTRAPRQWSSAIQGAIQEQSSRAAAQQAPQHLPSHSSRRGGYRDWQGAGLQAG